MPTARTALILSALLGAAAIGLGAFGAHALQGLLEASGRAGTWQTATLYHLVHAVALVWLATLPVWEKARAAWTCLFAGVAVFSGSLYLLCLTGTAWLGAVTPVGGVLMIAGWLLLLRLASSVQR
jgi:uncharacterized membrane protein YgdD (TMEM256/DUF423 family)